MDVSIQDQSSNLTRDPGNYNGQDICVGQWIANLSSGQAWMIITVESKTATSVTAIIQDVYRYNTLTATGNVGAVLPAGVTILSVKVNITSAGAGTLEVGKTGNTSAYMTSAENDTSVTGLYLAETDVDEASAEQVIATITGTITAKIVVTYQIN